MGGPGQYGTRAGVHYNGRACLSPCFLYPPRQFLLHLVLQQVVQDQEEVSPILCWHIPQQVQRVPDSTSLAGLPLQRLMVILLQAKPLPLNIHEAQQVPGQ